MRGSLSTRGKTYFPFSAALAAAFHLLAASGYPAAAAAPPAITLQPVVTTGLTSPVAVTNAGDGSGRLFITEQTGTLRIWNGTALLPTPFLDIHTLVSCCGEQGLLSVAFHPSYETNGFFYVDYTNVAGNTVIARYQVSADPNVADPLSASILLTIPQPYANHNGGQLQFGADGYLYIGMGDGGSGGDPQNHAQNLNDLLGKILRIDVDGGTPYAIPSTNPFVGVPNTRAEVWAYGLRNPWRFSFDRLSHDLYIGDVGQNLWEEIDFRPASSPGGENYGWRLMEGFHCYNPAMGCDTGTLTHPILEYGHTVGCSVTGGFVYRGSSIPQLFGVYLYGDFCTGIIWGAARDCSGVWSTNQLLDSPYNVSSFGEDESGEVYLTHLGGAVYRVASTPDHLVPAVADMSPTVAIQGDPGLVLTVNGSGFDGGSVVRWNGTDRPTALLCPTRLSATISASDLSTAGTATVTVFNPAPAGGSSSGLTFFVNPRFLDVPLGYWAGSFIDKLFNNGVSAGCGLRLFCPESPVTRAQAAVFLLRAKNGSTYMPPPATGTVFADVPATAFAASWIEALASAGITAGCGGGNYCPNAGVTRAQMAVFLLRTKNGSSYTPPPANGTVFADVPTTAFAASWIEALAAAGITAGCGGGNYCPNSGITRAQEAVFLVTGFNLP
jgi:glucose/arabinose dehydrogenase